MNMVLHTLSRKEQERNHFGHYSPLFPMMRPTAGIVYPLQGFFSTESKPFPQNITGLNPYKKRFISSPIIRRHQDDYRREHSLLSQWTILKA